MPQSPDLHSNNDSLNQEQLRRLSESIMRTVIDSALDAVIVIDEKGFIIEWNQQATNTFGWDRFWAIGRRLSDTFIPERYREGHERGMQHFLRTGDGPVLNKRLELTAINKEGKEFPVELSIIPNKMDGVYFFSSFVRDLTEIKKTERTLNLVNELAVSLLGKNSIEEIAWEITKNTIGLLGLEDCVIYILDEDKQELYQTAAYGAKNPEGYTIENPIVIPVGSGVVGQAALHKQTVLLNDTSEFPEYIVDGDYKNSELAVPIIHDGKVIGVIDSEHKEKNFYHKNHLDAFTTIASLCSGALNSAINIKKREEAEQSLRESEERWHNLILNMPEAVQITKNGKVLYINPAGVKLFEAKSKQDLIGLTADKLLTRFSHGNLREIRKQIEKIGTAEPMEFEISTLEGNRKFIEATSTIMYYKGERVVQSVLRDITEKKASDARLTRLTSRLQTLLDNLNTGVLMQEADNRIVHANKQFSDIFDNQFSPEMITGQTCDVLVKQAKELFINPDEFERQTAKILKNAQPSMNEELKLVNGKILRRDFIPITHNGLNIGSVWQYSDITDIKMAEENLRRALESERSYNDLNRNFVSMVSHEFRTPLTSIHSTSELLLQFSDRFNEEERKKRVKRIYDSTRRMNQLIEDVLTMGKLDSENSKIDLKEVNFTDLLNDLLKVMNASELVGRVVNIEQGYEQDCIVTLDINLTELILRNLIENAAKYSESDKPINISYFKKDRQFHFICQDFGIGIPEKEQAHIFESFKRAGNTAEIKGTGLGLAIVKKAVDRLNGELAFISEEGKGTTFTLKLPLIDHFDEKSRIIKQKK